MTCQDRAVFFNSKVNPFFIHQSFITVICTWPIPVSARSKARVCGSFAGIAVSNPAVGMTSVSGECRCLSSRGL